MCSARASENNSSHEFETPPQSRFFRPLRKIFLPILLALISTSAFSEIILNFFSIFFQNQPNWIGITYQPSNNEGGFSLFYDDWKLKTSNGRVNASIQKDEETGDNKWIAQGYLHNGTISLSYAANKIENKGVGVFYLTRVGSENEYRGHQINFDCDATETLACPYIIVPFDAKNLLKDEHHMAYLKSGCIKTNAPPPVAACKKEH